jgi:hypothetical protein
MIYLMHTIKHFFTDKQGKVVLWQMPNAPLISWFAFLLLAKTVSAGEWRSWAGHLSTASLLLWSALEIGWGVSYFRRALGVLVCIAIAARSF